MGILAWILGLLGALCFVSAIIAALGLCLLLCQIFTPMFWLGLSVALFLACIASALAARTPEE